MDSGSWFWGGRDVLSTRGLPRQAIEQVLKRAGEIDRAGLRVGKPLEGKILGSMFFEPSTRTQFSFQTAMMRLGGHYIGFSSSKGTSSEKGEDLHDTVKLVDACADVIVLRHPEVGSAQLAANAASKPVINGGDGSNQHPTQTMLDLYTVQKERGTIDGLTFVLTGDLLYGRTVHSLAYALSNYDVKLILASSPQLAMPREIVDEVSAKISVEEVHSGKLPLEGADVVYATRVQKERFADPQEYLKHSYVLGPGHMKAMKGDSRLLHPLPRVGEIDPAIDSDPRAAYFRQEANGVPVRMALLELLLA